MPLKDLKEKVKDVIHQGKDVISQSKDQAMTKGDKLHKQMAPAFERHNEKMRTKSGATADDTTTITGTSATQDSASAVPSEPQLGVAEDVPSRTAPLGGDAQLKPTDETPSGGVTDALGAPPAQAASTLPGASSDLNNQSSNFNQASDFNKSSDFNKPSSFNQSSDFNKSSDFNQPSDFNTTATTTTAERPVSPPHESSRDFLNAGAGAADSSNDARVWDPVSTEQSRGVNTDTSFGRDQDVLTRGSSSNIGGSSGPGGAGFGVYGGEGAQQDAASSEQQQQGTSSGSAAKRFIPDVIGNMTGRSSDESCGAGDMQSGSGEALGRTPLGETTTTGSSSGGGGAFMPRESGTAQAEGDPLPADTDLQRVSTSQIAPAAGSSGGSAQQTEQLPYGDSDKLRGCASGDVFGASSAGNVAPSEAPAVAAGEVPLLSKTGAASGGGLSWRDQGSVSHSHQFRDAGDDRSAQHPGLSAPTEEEMPSSSQQQQQFGGGSSEQQGTSAAAVDPFTTSSSNLTPSAPAASTGEPPLLASSSEQQQQQAPPASNEPSLLERVSSVFTRSTK